MSTLKKLAFAPFFLASFGYLCFLLPNFIKSSSVLSLSLESLIPFLTISALTMLSSLFLALVITLSQDWKLISPVALIAALIPLLFLPTPLSFYLVIGFLVSFFIIAAILIKKLKTYLTFQPSVLLSPSVRNLATLLALIISIVYFLSIDGQIKQNGIQIPDSLIDSALKFAPQTDSPLQTNKLTDQQKQLLDQAKKNPKLLEGSGYTLKDLEAIEQAANGTNPTTLKGTIKKQFETMVKPYQGFVAPSLAVLTFFSLISFISLLGLLIPILLWFTFWLLKETGFIKFATEMREVKKLVV